MKILDLALNAVIILSAMLFLAYVGYIFFDFGLFTVLPDDVTDAFLAFGALQYVALGVLVAALVAKAVVGRRLKARRAGRGTSDR